MKAWIYTIAGMRGNWPAPIEAWPASRCRVVVARDGSEPVSAGDAQLLELISAA